MREKVRVHTIVCKSLQQNNNINKNNNNKKHATNQQTLVAPRHRAIQNCKYTRWEQSSCRSHSQSGKWLQTHIINNNETHADTKQQTKA